MRDVDSSVAAAVAGETVRTRTTIQQRPHCPHYQGVRLFHQTRFKKYIIVEAYIHTYTYRYYTPNTVDNLKHFSPLGNTRRKLFFNISNELISIEKEGVVLWYVGYRGIQWQVFEVYRDIFLFHVETDRIPHD